MYSFIQPANISTWHFDTQIYLRRGHHVHGNNNNVSITNLQSTCRKTWQIFYTIFAQIQSRYRFCKLRNHRHLLMYIYTLQGQMYTKFTSNLWFFHPISFYERIHLLKLKTNPSCNAIHVCNSFCSSSLLNAGQILHSSTNLITIYDCNQLIFWFIFMSTLKWTPYFCKNRDTLHYIQFTI